MSQGVTQLSVVEKLNSASDAEGMLQVVSEFIDTEGIFVFGEILESKRMQENKQSAAYKLLELFAFGTFQDYESMEACNVTRDWLSNRKQKFFA